MRKTPVRAVLVILSAAMGFNVNAQATTDSTHHDSTSQVTAAAAAPTPTSGMGAAADVGFAMPLDIRGYRMTDSLRLRGAGHATQYTYTQPPRDRITVLVSPYDPATPLRTQDDTTGMLQSTVNVLRESLDNDYRQGNLTAFNVLSERTDDVKAAGHKIRGYSLVVGLTHPGAVTLPTLSTAACNAGNNTVVGRDTSRQFGSGVSSEMTRGCSSGRAFEAYVYYAAWAFGDRIIRVRADLPLQVAANEQAPEFAKKLLAALAGSR